MGSFRTSRSGTAAGLVSTVSLETVTALANLSKQFAYALVDVQVAYGENLDLVAAIIREVGAVMQQDPSWGPRVLDAPSPRRW